MVRDSTDPGLAAVVQLEPRQKRSPMTLVAVVGLVASLATAAPFVFGAINWPWESKDSAASAHAKLQSSIDVLRDEHRAGDAAAEKKLDLILERLPKPKKGKP